MGNVNSSISVPVQIAGGLAAHGIANAPGVSGAVANIADEPTAMVRVSEAAYIDSPSGTLCVKTRDGRASWVIVDPDGVDAPKLRRELKREIVQNIYSIQNTAAFAAFLSATGPTSKITTATMLANLLITAVDQYVTPGAIARRIQASYTASGTMILNVRGRVESWEVAAATANVQNTNTVVLKNAIVDILSADGTIKYLMCTLAKCGAKTANGDSVARYLIWIVFITSMVVVAILIMHCWNVRERFRREYCPWSSSSYVFSCPDPKSVGPELIPPMAAMTGGEGYYGYDYPMTRPAAAVAGPLF